MQKTVFPHEKLHIDSNLSSGFNWGPRSSEATTLPAVPLWLKHMKENPFGLVTLHCLFILFTNYWQTIWSTNEIQQMVLMSECN